MRRLLILAVLLTSGCSLERVAMDAVISVRDVARCTVMTEEWDCRVELFDSHGHIIHLHITER